MKKKVVTYLGYFFLILFIAVTMAFSGKSKRNITCSEIRVIFDTHDLIKIGEDEILRIVHSVYNQPSDENFWKMDTEMIEKEILNHQAIENAEVYKVAVKDSTSYKGVLAIRVKHREPILRIMSATGSYYLDRKGEKIPLSTGYAPRVLVASGYFSEEWARDYLLPLYAVIEEDRFWSAQIVQVFVDKDEELFLTPLIGDLTIEFGEAERFSEKLRNLRAFYDHMATDGNWEEYKRINVKYKDQIIAKKR